MVHTPFGVHLTTCTATKVSTRTNQSWINTLSQPAIMPTDKTCISRFYWWEAWGKLFLIYFQLFLVTQKHQRFSMICYNTVYLSQKTPVLVTLIFNLRAWFWWYSNRQHYCQKHLVVKGVNTPQMSIFAHTAEIKKLNNPLTHVYSYKSRSRPVRLYSLTAFWNTVRSKLTPCMAYMSHK